MNSCEDGPGRKAGLPTWGRVGQVRLGLWKKKKKKIMWGGGSESKEKSNRNTMMEVQREESSWASRGQCSREAA